MTAACAGVRTAHLEAGWVSLLPRLNRTLYHVLIAGVNVRAESASYADVALLLLLCSDLDIGHVVLYVLHIVSSILIRLIGLHQVV